MLTLMSIVLIAVGFIGAVVFGILGSRSLVKHIQSAGSLCGKMALAPEAYRAWNGRGPKFQPSAFPETLQRIIVLNGCQKLFKLVGLVGVILLVVSLALAG